jgi:hypothetical protein
VLIGAGVLCDYFAENNQTQKITKWKKKIVDL